MADSFRARVSNTYALAAHSLSGRLLVLTLAFVLMTEAVIFFPSIASQYRRILEAHIESSEIAILPFTELGNASLSDALRHELLVRAGARAVILRRPEQRELFLPNEPPKSIDVVTDLRHQGFLAQIGAAVDCLTSRGDRVVRVIAPTRITGAQAIEVVLGERALREELTDYAQVILEVALIVSAVTAALVFFSLYRNFVRPMRLIVQAMIAFRANPEDASRILQASNRRDEIGITERELGAMQREIYGFLQQKGRLAALGTAVAKIQHDLRNILASAQLASGRLSDSDDPVVKRLAPRLVAALDRAVALATNTLRFGRADELPPQRRRVALVPILAEAIESARASIAGKPVMFEQMADETLEIDADPDQLHRILLNLLRNAAEAVGDDGHVRVTAARKLGGIVIDIADDGPGIPQELAARLFQPFASTARAGGTGLGLAISRELARAHGGDVKLIETGPGGSRFRIDIPERR